MASPPRIRISRLHQQLAVLGAVWLLVEHALGAGAPSPAPVSAAWIGFIVAAFSTVAGWLGAAGGAIASALVTVVKWLSHGVGWLTDSLRKVITSTGGMFRRVWESARGLWSRVIRPFIIRVHDWIGQLRDWLKRIAGPVFEFLNELRAKIREIYDKFIRPVLDTIAVIRGTLQVLAKLNVPWAKALDQYLAKLESAIVENYLKLTGAINRVINVVDSVVTFELLFQRVPFLRTLQRDVRGVFGVIHGSRLSNPDNWGGDSSVDWGAPAPAPAELEANFQRYLEFEDGPLEKLVSQVTFGM